MLANNSWGYMDLLQVIRRPPLCVPAKDPNQRGHPQRYEPKCGHFGFNDGSKDPKGVAAAASSVQSNSRE